MELHLSSNQRIRVSTNSERIFFDSESGDCQSNLSADFYTMHRIVIVEKVGVVKLFSFEKNYHIRDDDFGFWSDAKLVWTNCAEGQIEKIFNKKEAIA